MIDPEIWRIAAGVVRQHGDRAGALARERIAQVEDTDAATLKIWMMVVAAVDEILRTTRSEGECLN